MKVLRKFLKHRIIIGVCAVFISVIALTATLVPAFTANVNKNDNSHVNTATDESSGSTEQQPEEVYEIKPMHEYTGVTASLNSGAKIYVGVTTAHDLKNNLKVLGTFSSGDKSVSVNLRKSEYSLQISIGSYEHTLSENDVVLDNMPAETDQVNLVIKVKRANSEIAATVPVGLASLATEEDYNAFDEITGITVDTISSLTNDYDKESLKEIIVVKDSAGKVIANKELYEVTELSSLTPGNSATFTVTYQFKDKVLTASGKISSVTQANILAADFSVNPEYRLDGMYYKKRSTIAGEEEKWFSAFVAGTEGIAGSTLEDIYGDGLKITVHYSNSSRMLSFPTIGENSATADTSEYVVFNNTNFIENNNDISAQVYNHIGGQSVSASISVNFELAKVIEIKATGFNETIELTSKDVATNPIFMQPGSDSSYIITRANTGVWNKTFLSSSQFTAQGTLNPTAEVLAQVATMTPEQLKTFKYDKEVTIIYGPDTTITTKYAVQVLYNSPTSWNTVNIVANHFPDQTMRMPFNYGDLSVTIKWGNQRRDVPLVDFLDAEGKSSHIRITFYRDTAGTDEIGCYIGETPIITKEVKSILVEFRYDLTEGSDWSSDGAFAAVPELNIKKYVVTLPTFDTSTVSFSTNTIKTITFNSSIDQEILDGITLGVFEDDTYSTLSTFAQYNQSSLSKTEDIQFLAGGLKYYIELKISDELKEEVEWASGEGVSGTVIHYVVEISKGPITPVVVSYGNGSWVYGSTPEVPKITGTRIDGSNLNIVYGDSESDIASNELIAKYTIHYYLKTATGWETTPLTDNLPVGEYYVQVLVPDTTNYLAATSTPGPGYGCPTIEVTPAPLTPDNLLPNITFDGIARDADDFVTGITGIQYGDTDVVVAGSLKSLSTGIPLVGNKALHAGKYSVKLTIADAHKSNYMWAKEVTVNKEDNSVTKEFEIYKRQLGYDITNEAALGFVYDSDTLPTPTFGYSDQYDSTTSPYLSPTKPSYFFAIEGDTKYYNSKNEEVVAADFKKWPVGTYTIKRTLSVASGHLATDYSLPTASATFTISPKEIDRIEDVSVSQTYNGVAWEYSILGWNSDNDNEGTPILTGVLSGNPFDANGTVDTTITNLANYNTSFNANTGTISVLHAGVYTFTISLNSNYVWKSVATTEEGEAPSNTPIITLTMNQKELKGSLKSANAEDDYIWNDNTFEFNPTSTTGQETPTITMVGLGLADQIQLNYTLHYASGTLVTDKTTMTADEYYYLLTGWTGTTNAEGYNLANNYKFPTEKKIITFTVQSAALDDVLFATTLSGIYQGSAYDFTAFITNIDAFLYGTEKNSKVLYYVVSDSANHENAEKLNGEILPKLTDTGKYTIYVYPNTNFDWANASSMSPFGTVAPEAIQNKKGFVATFTITPKAIEETDIVWGTTTFTYNGKEQTPTPSISASALLNTTDQGDVKLNKVTLSAGTSNGTTAGGYTAVLDGFTSTSTRAFNYTLSNFSKEITINPFELDAPSMASKTGVFTGLTQDLAVTLPTATGVTGFNANDLIHGEVLGGFDAVGATAHAASYSSGVFSYLNSGKYKITFTLTDTQNYKWKNSLAEIVIDEIQISRMEITAPALGGNRTLEYDGDTKKPSLNSSLYVTIANTKYYLDGNGLGVNVNGHHISWSVEFAKYESSGFQYLTDSIDPTQYGTYYIQFNISDSGDQNHLNYEWKENTLDKTNIEFLTESGWGDVAIQDEGTLLFLAYMITRKIFKPTLDIQAESYIFGDNGIDSKYTQGALDDDASYVHLADSDDAKTVLAANPTITYKIYSLDVLNHDFDSSAHPEITDLVHGLPWNVGYYGIYVYIDFGDGSQFENIPLKHAFEIKPKDIIVEWNSANSIVESNTSGWEMQYTSTTYTPNDLVTAAVTNLAKKSESDTPVSPTITISSNPASIKNVGTYTFTVSITGTDTVDKNYSVKTEEASIKTTLKINPVTLDLVGVKNCETFEYGTTPTLSGTNWWNYAVGSAKICSNDKAEEILTYEIKNTSNKFSVGSYDVVIQLASGVTNYVLSDDTAEAMGSISVVAREITLVFDETKASSVYQKDKIQIGTPYTVTYKGVSNSTDWLVSGDDVAQIFVLRIMKDSNDVTDVEYNPVGEYSIMVIKGNDLNYIVHVDTNELTNENDTAKLGDYTITEATLTVDEILGNVNSNKVITYDANPYDWIQAIENQERPSLITYKGLSGVNLENNPVVWTITKKNTTETVSGATTNAFVKTSYIVTASANNHKPIEGIEVEVEIQKAVLTLSVDFVDLNSIYYGELLPTVDVAGYNDLTKNIFTVDGLKGADGRDVISGTFSFTSPDYSIWNAVGDYKTSMNVSGLTADNYTFETKAGSLHVQELPITITIPNLSNIYIQDVSSKEDSDVLLVDTFQELYNKLEVSIQSTVGGRVTTYLQTGKHISDIVTLVTEALLKDTDGNITATNDAKDYPFYLVETVGDLYKNYDITVETKENELEIPTEAVDGKVAVFTISLANNKFLKVFGFEGVDPLTDTETNIQEAWVYGVGATNGYDSSKHKIILPQPKLNRAPEGTTDNTTILYKLYYLNESNWVLLGEETSDIVAFFVQQLEAGSFNATSYKLEYIFKGNTNYSDATDTRYFKITPRDLYLWAKDSKTYYGEDFVRDVETLGLVDNGSGAIDELTDVLSVDYIYDYQKGISDAGSYGYTLEFKDPAEKYSNYICHWNHNGTEDVEGDLEVLRRPVVLTIDEKSSQYDFNKAHGDTGGAGEELTFTATLGENKLGIVFSSEQPFYGTTDTQFTNDVASNVFVLLQTNALLDGDIQTQNVGNYAIFASYKNDLAKKNYDISIDTEYERDEALEDRVNEFFTGYDFYNTYIEAYYSSIFSDRMISTLMDGSYKAGTYKITTANLSLTLSAPSTDYDGTGKAVEITGNVPNDPTGEVSYKAQYKYEDGTYLDDAPVNVGVYPVRIVVENPNYSFDAGSLGTAVRITERELHWSANINGDGNYSTSLKYGTNSTIYLGVGNLNELTVQFNNIYNNSSVSEGSDQNVRLEFDLIVNGKAVNGTPMTLADAYVDRFVSHSFDVAKSLYTLSVQHSGVYTVALKFKGTEAKNYKFPSEFLKQGTTDTYEFTFTVLRAKKTSVRAMDAMVQYGTPITANGTTTNEALFSGFKLDPNTLALIEAENLQLTGASDASKVTYSTEYDPATSTARGQYYVQPNGLLFYNYEVEYSNTARMTVQPREIVVVVQGAESKNTYASVVYTGELQGPDHRETLASHSYFVPQDLAGGIKWYGEAVADKDKNYAEIFNYYLNLYGDGSFGVNAGKGLNARTYYMNLNEGSGISNYDITFKNKSGQILTTATDVDTAPTFEIEKANLKVQAGSTGLYNSEDFTTQFTIPYGNLIEKADSSYYYLTAQYDGLVERDDTEEFIASANNRLTFSTVKQSGNGTPAYVAWDSHAGSVYQVFPVEMEFDNYKVTNWLPATMTVVSRMVTATTEDRIYTEYIQDDGKINYEQGRRGTYHAAQVVFEDYDASLYNTNGTSKYYTKAIEKDEYGVILDGIISKYAPQYTMKYVNVDDALEEILSDGPRMVGKYAATVIMSSQEGKYDYMVVSKNSSEGNTSTTLEYEVHTKKLSVRWNEVDDEYLNYNTGDDKQRDIEGFINDIMTVENINRQFTNSSSEQVVERINQALNLSGFTGGRYYIDANSSKVLIKIYGIGLYTATIRISSTAIRNYEWRDESGASGAEFTLAFRVATSSITIDSLEFTNGTWKFGESAPEISFSTNVSGAGLLYKYAKLDGLPVDYEKPAFGTMITNRDLALYLDQNNRGYSLSMPTDAGLYVMCAWYPGSDQYQMSEAFLVFEITKAVIEAPNILDSELDFKEEDGKLVIETIYTGNTLHLELGYDTKLLDIAYAGSMSAPTSGKGMILHATDVTEGGYTISFSLSDQSNYAWSDAAIGEYIWRVLPAEDNAIESFDVEELISGLTYGESYATPQASATYSNDVIIEYYVDEAWVTTKPVQAGTYKVRAVSPATKNYYAGAQDEPAISEEIEFVIEKRELYVTASGSMTYGDDFVVSGGSTYQYQFSGFINNDTASKVIVGDIQYTLVDAPGKLEVGDYDIQLEEANGEVVGMTADNYKIVAEKGTFKVNKKNIMVVLGDASTVYGQKIDLSLVTMKVVGDELVSGDEYSDLNINLTISSSLVDLDSRYNPAASYKVDAEGHTTSKNYNVTVFGSGVYTITPLSIYITVEAGGGVYQGEITPVRLTGVYTTEDNLNVLETFDEAHAPKIRFNYWGSSNDGNWSHTNAEMWSSEPTLAGNYYATAVSTQTNNYTLVTNMGTPSVSFVVEKKTLDDTNREVLFASPMEYTGSVVKPVITDHAFEGLYFTGETNFEAVGNYSVGLTLKDSANYKWSSVDSATCEIPFEIVRGYNAFESEVSILDWVYGAYDATKNLPNAEIKFGTEKDFTFSYSDAKDGVYTANVPTAAGTYWVKITAPQTDNYYSVTSDAKEFHITKAFVKAPTLVLVNEGDNQNTVYTGSRLQAVIQGFNPATMRMIYDGDSSLGNTVAIYGLNANTYSVSFVLNDSDNYAWAEDTTMVDGNAQLYWNVARKQIAKPTMNTNMFMVNGGTLTFIPVGFDEETMAIEGNKTSYGGSFKVTVTIKDTTNFEWSDGTVDEVVFDWFVVGWDTVFIIVVSVLGIIAAIAGIAIVIQYAVHKRKKKKELEDELAAQGLLEENMKPIGEPEAPNEEQAIEPEDGGKNNE